MPRPGVGNPGNSGGGRPSAYREKATAELLYQMFMGELTQDEVKEKLKTGKYSLKDAFIAKGMAGNERVLIELFKKFFPDKVIEESYGTERRIIIIRGDTPRNCPHCGRGLFGLISGPANALAQESIGRVESVALQDTGNRP